MWFEGVTTPEEFPELLKDLMTTIPPGKASPMWQMVSSNIGDTVDDDGYVFYSKGESGEDELYIGIKNAYSTTSWCYGHRLFIAESYVPSDTVGTNGAFTNVQYEALRYHYDNTWGNVDQYRLPLRYGISVNRDRVIITLRADRTHHNTHRVRSLMYLGLPNRYSDEADSTASLIATNYCYHYNYNNRIRTLKTKKRYEGSYYNVYHNETMPYVGRSHWSPHFMAMPVPIHRTDEGVRAELDGLLISDYYEEYHGVNLPLEGDVVINGKPYLAIQKNYNHMGYHCSFDTNNRHKVYFIEKK